MTALLCNQELMHVGILFFCEPIPFYWNKIPYDYYNPNPNPCLSYSYLWYLVLVTLETSLSSYRWL